MKIFFSNEKNATMVIFTVAAICIPVVLGTFLGYEINLTMLLLPFSVWGMLRMRDKLVGLFIVAYCAGLASILFAELLAPDLDFWRHVASLSLIMATASFVFLGRFLHSFVSLKRLVYWLALGSGIFIVVIALRIVFLGQAVRIFWGPYEASLSVFNANFLGLPVFGSFGVLSLADLLVMQVLILSAALFDKNAGLYFRAFVLLAIASGSFLIWGSGSRSVQALLFWILATIFIYVAKIRAQRLLALCATLFIVLGALLAFQYASFGNEDYTNSRLETSIQKIESIVGKNVDFSEVADEVSTGRLTLISDAAKEVIESPIIGNGFSGFERFGHQVSQRADNTSTHVYFLTLLWKGGLLFVIPFGVFVFLLFKSIFYDSRAVRIAAERFFLLSLILLSFGPMALFWDILIVPSAGALAFFLLGFISKENHARPRLTS